MKTAAKDFKMTELGPIPKDWEVKRLGELVEVYDGTHQTPTYVECGYPFYSVENITSNDFVNVKRISEDEHKRLTKSHRIEKGDVLMTRIGSIGDCKYVDWDVQASYYVSLALLKKKGCLGIDMRYLALASESELFKKNILLNSLQFAIPQKINLGKISDVLVLYPPLPEQRKIAAALSDVDEMIAALEKMIEKKRKIRTGAMQRLLTGNTRLPGFKGAWVEKRFEDVFVHVPSKTYQIAAEEYLSGGLFPVVDQGQSTVVGFSNRKDKVFRVNEEGVIVFGDHTRIIKYVDFDFVVGADGTQLLLGNSTIADTRFLSYCLERLDIPNLGYSRHFKYVKDGAYAVPPTLAEQKAIAKVLGDMDEEIAALEAELAKTRQLKQGMMQELLTGKTRLI